jgi:hypothetical protein
MSQELSLSMRALVPYVKSISIFFEISSQNSDLRILGPPNSYRGVHSNRRNVCLTILD